MFLSFDVVVQCLLHDLLLEYDYASHLQSFRCSSEILQRSWVAALVLKAVSSCVVRRRPEPQPSAVRVPAGPLR